MSTPKNTADASSITFLTGSLAGQTFQITSPATTIGRHSTNDIVVKDDLEVSRQHARLLWQDGSWRIENLSSSSILMVNQKYVQHTMLEDGAVVSLGKQTTFRFTVQAASIAAGDEGPTSPELKLDVQPPAPLQMLPASHSAGPLPPDTPTEIAPASPPLFAPPRARSVAADPIDDPIASNRRASRTLIASAFLSGIPSLEISNNTTGLRKLHALSKAVISVGRDATNDIVIDDPTISTLHLQVIREGNQWVLLHPHPARPQTTNGLLFQGRRIRGNEPFRKTLVNGDVFRIGDEQGTLISLSFQDGSGNQMEAPPLLEPIRLEAAELTIGRKPDNTVVLQHSLVSAYHARLVREGGTYRLLDLRSTNHVYVNGQVVTNYLLKMGDEIRIGPYRLVYESTHLTQYDDSNNIRIDALNLHKVAANQTTLLNDISLSIPPRAFVALVGGSGAGKTTLLDALSGLRPAQQGQVLYNGQDAYRNLAAFSTQIGYVPQDDIVHRNLSVERALYYAAKIRLPADFTEEQVWQRISEVLEDVELSERRKLLIKKLSGGQRKRVSIAMELLGNPSLFFLDEPTSGLDPGLDRKMMVLLRKLADKGHTIILVTHATNNINVCDAVCFLASGGRLAYYGPPEGAKAFFSKTDFAEIYTSLAVGEGGQNVPEEAEARFKASSDYETYVAQPLNQQSALDGGDRLKTKQIKRPKPGKLLKQFWLLSQRNLELLKNDRGTLALVLLQAPVIALFLMILVRFEIGAGVFTPNNVVQCQPQIPTTSGAVGLSAQTGTVSCDLIVTFLQTQPAGISYAQARGGVNQALQDFILPGQGINAQRTLFLCAFIAVLNGVLNAIREIVKEAPIYRRERTVNLGIVPYVLSKVLILGVLALFQSGALILVVNAFEPLHQGVFLPVFIEAYITLALSALAGMMVGLLVSALAPNEDIAQSLLPFILIPQIIFAGVEIPLRDWVTTTLALFFPTRWTMTGLGSSLGLHGDKLGGDSLLVGDYTYHGTLFSTYSQSDAMQRILLAWLALGILILVFGVGVGAALKWKDGRWQ